MSVMFSVMFLSGEVLIEAETLQKNQRLLDAQKLEVQAKEEIKEATKKLEAAQKIIEEELSRYLRFSSHTELGYIATSGNTDTQTASLDTTEKLTFRDHAFKLHVDYIYGKDAAIESRNKLTSEINYDYKFSKYFALNYLMGYKDDKFSGFAYQFYTGPGIKHIAINNDQHELNFQSNILYSVDLESDKFYNATGAEIKYPFVDPSKDQTALTVLGEKNEYASILLKGDYTWKISKDVKFIQDISYRLDLRDSEIYFINSKTGVLSKVNATFSMGINYKVDYVNSPPAGNRYTDNTLSVTLGIDY